MIQPHLSSARHAEFVICDQSIEQVIGRMKMRSRTVRGYKSTQGMLAALLLAGLGATC
jgi:hypothetical protein